VKENNVRRIRYNEEINTLPKGEDILRFIKSQRIRWLGHVERMEDNSMPKRMLKGRPRMRWLDDVESDLKKMEVKGWKEKVRDREQWRLVVEEAKAHLGLQRRPAGMYEFIYKGRAIKSSPYTAIFNDLLFFPF
jgi:hypothetical protein